MPLKFPKADSRLIAEHAKSLESYYADYSGGGCSLEQLEDCLDQGILFANRDDLCQKGPFSRKKKTLMKYYTIPYFDHVYPHMEFKDDMNVLFIAAGSGMDIMDLFKYTQCKLNIYGVEINSDMVRFCHKNKVPGIIVQGAAEKLPFPEDVFDIVISCETIEHVVNPEDMIAEIFRTGKPGCQVFIGTPNGASLAANHVYDRLSSFKTGKKLKKHGIIDNHYTPAQLRRIVRNVHGQIVLQKMIVDMPFYFLCGSLPEKAGFLIPTIKTMTEFTQEAPFFNRVFCDQAKYFFRIEKESNSGVGYFQTKFIKFVCPECKGNLENRKDVYHCLNCKSEFLKKDEIIHFISQEESQPQKKKSPRFKEHRKRRGLSLWKVLLSCVYNTGLIVLWACLVPAMLAMIYFAKKHKPS